MNIANFPLVSIVGVAILQVKLNPIHSNLASIKNLIETNLVQEKHIKLGKTNKEQTLKDNLISISLFPLLPLFRHRFPALSGDQTGNLHRKVQYLLDESFLNEEPSVRSYQRSDCGAVLGSSLELFAIMEKGQGTAG